jgi:predicted permease
MTRLRILISRLAGLFRKARLDQEFDEEVRSHLEMLTEENLRQGMPPEEARYAALRSFGGVEQVKEASRDVRGPRFLEDFAQDVRSVCRTLVKSPGFTVLSVATLGVALGANAAIFGLLDKVVFRPLPVKSPSELVILSVPILPTGAKHMLIIGGSGGKGGQRISGVSYPVYVAFRDHLDVFRGVLAQRAVSAAMLAGTQAIQTEGVLASGNYFEVLGVKAALGRTLTPDDDRVPSGHPVVVLAHGFWQRQFGGDPTVLNRMIRLNNFPLTIIGVAAAGFTGTVSGESPDFFVPLAMADDVNPVPGFKFYSPEFSVLMLMARLAPSVSLKQAESGAETFYQRLLLEASARVGPIPDDDRRVLASLHVVLLPGGYAASQQSAFSRDLTIPLTLSMAMVVLVLVIAAGNVTNLFLARGAARARETAIRFALGATRWRLLRERLLESLLVALSAGCVGLLFATWTAGLMPVVLNLKNLPAVITATPDRRAAIFVLAISMAAGLCMWAASALRVTRQSALPALVESGALRTGHARSSPWRRGLLVTQAALSLVLFCSSVLLSRSLINLMAVDPGFSVGNLFSFSVEPSQAGYDASGANTYFTQVLSQLGETPGVRAVSMTTSLPLSGGFSGTWVIGDLGEQGSRQGLLVDVVEVGPAYFSTLGLPLVAGREFTAQDIAGAPKVAVLNQSLARALFDGREPLGRLIGYKDLQPDMQVVGIVKDIKTRALRSPVIPTLFLPRLQQAGAYSATVVLRAAGRNQVTNEAVRAVLNRINPSIPVVDFGSVGEQIGRSLYRDRMLAFLSLCFAGFAGLLCAAGIFGLISLSVRLRAKEIGVRMVLGASRSSIYWLVMREVAGLTALGGVVGLAGFLASSRVLRTFLFELTPTDLPSLLLATLALGCAAFVAGLLPAYRAAHLALADTLRHE